MDKIKELRDKIDKIDEQIFRLFDERFKITAEVGRYKRDKGIEVTHSNREADILSKIGKFEFNKEIKELYCLLFEISKRQQR
ncbi:chorismate mutase [Mycoplasmatota bacterium zrk1]